MSIYSQCLAAAVLVGGSLVIGTARHAIESPNWNALVAFARSQPRVYRVDATELRDARALRVVVDGRAVDADPAAGPQNAVRIPFDQAGSVLVEVWPRLEDADVVVVVDEDQPDEGRQLARTIAVRTSARRVSRLAGGVTAWRDAGLPIGTTPTGTTPTWATPNEVTK